MNRLYQQLQQNPLQTHQNLPLANNPKLSTLLKNLNSLSNSSNPMSLIQNLVKDNPQMQSVMQLFQNSQMSPKQFFYQYLQNNGIDPDQALNSVKREIGG